MEFFKRKKYLILPSYQLRLTIFLVIILLLVTILHGFFLYQLTSKSIEEGLLSAHNRLRSTWEVLKPAIILTDGFSFFLTSLCFGISIVLISHRLIGPLFKFENRLREIASGRLDLLPLKLRKNDEAQILGDALNEMQNTMKERFEILEDLNKKLNTSEPPSIKEIKDTLETALKNIKTEQ
ncbi:MAG: HAMP domain-containing protein [Candidatus Riflebacteria bacterium]|nr:HAMP domain-containing protein [Candidatus Riflebacteria bacterium]